jgi:hypothetical protein
MFPLALCTFAALPASSAGYWCTHALNNVFRDTPVPVSPSRRVEVSAARGQTVGAQIVLTTEQPRRVLKVDCSPLRHANGRARIAPGAFAYALVEYYHVEKNSKLAPKEELARVAPADFPDAFSEAREMALKPGENQPVWVRFAVPSNAPAGDYAGTLTLTLDDGTLTVPVRLTVYDFTLPTKTRLWVTVWMNTGSLAKHLNAPEDGEKYWQALQRTARLMRAHHQNTILTSWGLLKAARTDSGLQFDFRRFDRWVETFLKEGFERIEIGHVGGREHGEWEDKNFVAYTLACENRTTGKAEQLQIEEFLPALESHLREKGWLSRSMIHVADEPIGVNVESWKKLSERVRAAAPGLRRIDAIHVPDLRGHLETWVPQLNYLEQWNAQFLEMQKEGVELWYYTAWVPQGRYPNRLMDFPLLKTRILHWLNYLSGTTGYLHWGFNFWDVPFDQFAPGDNWIVWPGKDAPRSSLRYEAMREGIEDYEYLCMLQDAAARAAKRLKRSDFDARSWTLGYAHLVMQTFQDYSRDPARMLEARDAIARAVVALRSESVPVLAAAKRANGGVEVTGTTVPGAQVSWGSAKAAAGRDGRFMLRGASDGPTVTLDVTTAGRHVRLPLPVTE